MIDPGRCRLLRHTPAPGRGYPGAWNMAVDEMLLERAQDRAIACLRFYGWSEPTLSLGYFQAYADRKEHPASLPCAAVRRLTGGGAILHDVELTYSIVLPGTHPLAARRDELYKALHGSLIEALGRLGIAARMCQPAGKIETAREPFLCFQRRSPGDVLIGETKVCGSAQRRRNGAVLQHGSLLGATSPAAPELPGVADLATHPIELERTLKPEITGANFPEILLENIAELWLSNLSRRLGFSWQSDDLDEKELRRAETLVETRYSWDNWTQNRDRAAGHSQESL